LPFPILRFPQQSGAQTYSQTPRAESLKGRRACGRKSRVANSFFAGAKPERAFCEEVAIYDITFFGCIFLGNAKNKDWKKVSTRYATNSMNTSIQIRRAKCVFAASVIFFLLLISARAGENVPSFLHIGDIYEINYISSAPGGFPLTVKILENVGGGWFRVGYMSGTPGPLPAKGEGQSITWKHDEMWLNFSIVSSVMRPSKENPYFKPLSSSK
jgi:hypothetical protein